MIVKDEENVIRETLENLCKYIKFDYWVISDTGSIDRTKEIIQEYFKDKDIPGELFEDKWQDFASNRTIALEYAYDKTDYLLIFDADDRIHGNFNLPSSLTQDSYDLKMGIGTCYVRPLLVNNRKRWKFMGVLHEYLKNIDPVESKGMINGDYFIESGKKGNRSSDPNKYKKDAEILEKAFEIEKDTYLRYRYAFYCAQSYKDCDNIDKSIEWYKKVLSQDNWIQEKYISCMNIGNLYEKKKDMDNALEYWIKSYEYDPERNEGGSRVMEYYYNKGQHLMVNALYHKFKDRIIISNSAKLFLDTTRNYLVEYFNSISAYYVNDKASGYECCKNIILTATIKFQYYEQTVKNLIFYTEFLDKDKCRIPVVRCIVNYIKLTGNKDIWNTYKTEIRATLKKSYNELEERFKEKNIDKSSKYASSNKILVYTGWMTHLWNESHLGKKALGGAEKAVAYLMRELPKSYEIIVSGDVEEGIFDNVTYIHQNKLQGLLDGTEFHAIIISRNISFLTEYNNLKCFQLILSLHDTHILNNGNNAIHVLDMYNDNIDKFITMTPWHKSNIINIYPSINPDKIKIINNGIDVSLFNNNLNNKIKNKFIWSSRSERGLHILLNIWREIINKLPDATLDICSYGDFPKDNADNNMIEIINKFDSITHHGKLNSIELYDLMAKSEYWLYTNTFPETSCITAMEMLMSEVVCLYYPLAGLNDTVGDYGIPVNQGEEIEALVHLTTEKKAIMREKGREYALSCSWKNRAEEWSNLLGANFHVKNDRIKYLHENFTLPLEHINFLKKLGSEFKPNVIYDIGANVLNWTREAKDIWPESEIVLFDAVNSFEDYYLKSKNKFFIGVLSDCDDKNVKFYQNSEHPAGNSYYKEIGHKKSEIIYPESNYSNEKTSTLSTVVKEFDFPMPDLIKFDVQGAELDIIKGSLDIINRAKYLIVEIQNTQYNRNAPLLNETVNFLQMNGWELLTQKPFCDNGPDGDYCFKKKIKIGVFNSFSFHYEMFGFILSYAKNNYYEVDIFTNQINDLGWIDFYRKKFNNFNIIDFNKFDGNTQRYSFFFVATDDDPLFKSEWISNNVICLNHYYKIRSPSFNHYLNIANFKESSIDYTYPCYPLMNYQDKIQNNSVCIIGCGCIVNFHTINRLHLKEKIKLYICYRSTVKININDIDKNKFDISLIEDADTKHMFEILKKATYVFINYNDSHDYSNGIICSGSLQLALSTLCLPIMINTANQYLKIKNALEFNIDSDESIVLGEDINFNLLEEERSNYIDKFDKYLDNIKQSYNFEHDEINVALLDNIKGYKSIYQNYMNRANTEIMFRKLITYIFPYFKDKNIIDLGAYIGDNSIPWALKSSGIIYAIDPSKENTDFINKMSKHNNVDNIITITKAISDKSEVIYCNELETTHISCNNVNGRHSFEATSLDNLNLDNIGFIHLDVEGFEYKVLNGSTNIINKYNPIIVWENHIEKEDYMKIINFFSSRNYNTFLINEQFPHCFPDCRNFISLPENSNININKLNNKFKDSYKEFTPDKNKPFLIEVGVNKNIYNDFIRKSTRKSISLMMYGDFRTYKNNLCNNLNELRPFFRGYNVYVFILTDKTGVNSNYSKEDEKEILGIFKEYGFNIGFVKYTIDLDILEEEKFVDRIISSKINKNKYFPNQFVPKLLYRKYKLASLVDAYSRCNNIQFDISILTRVFDTIIKKNISSRDIYSRIKDTDFRNTIYFSPDTTYIGTTEVLLRVLYFKSIYNEEIWDDNKFIDFAMEIDSVLVRNRDTYAPEIQYIANIYYTNTNCVNIRVNIYDHKYTTLHRDVMYKIILDPHRHTNKDINNQTICSLTRRNSISVIDLKVETVKRINRNIEQEFLDFLTKFGLQDYNKGIGIEHYQLLCNISSQIEEGIIIDIGTHNGNSCVCLGYNVYKGNNNTKIYTFDIKNLLDNSCKSFFDKYDIEYLYDNIFETHLLQKYSSILLNSRLILVDIDPHNGILEYEFLYWLYQRDYKGILLFDDINLREGHIANNYAPTLLNMTDFWDKIPYKYKLNLTHLGHWSGTGLVYFNKQLNNIILDNTIPKRIFHTWENNNINPEFQNIINKWTENNPNYEYTFYTSKMREEFILNNFGSKIYNVYNKIIPGAYKADLWRYCILYKYGGFYTDIDMLCTGHLDELLDNDIEFIVPIDLNINPLEGQHNLACGFIGSIPGSPILLGAINRIVDNVEKNIIPNSVLNFSGPGLLGRSVNCHLGLPEDSSVIGKEGVFNRIKFLEFTSDTEYIRDTTNNTTIAQNKNGNKDIQRLYSIECKKLKDHIDWVSCTQPIKI